MKRLFSLISVVVLTSLFTGCGEEPVQQGNPPPLAIAEVPAVLESGFVAASDEVRTITAASLKAISQEDYPAATMILQKLCTLHELTNEQRMDATRSLRAAQDEMAKAAEAGSKEAEKVHTYILENK